MLVTLAGIVILVSELQYSNALKPMLVTPSSIVMLVSVLQSSKARLSMLSPLFITTSLK